MTSGKHERLPASEVRAMTDDLQLQAIADGVTVSVATSANSDGTVDVTWTVNPDPKQVLDPGMSNPAMTVTVTSGPTSMSVVRDQILGAADKLGVDESLLAGIAFAESSLNPQAQSHSSTAFGLFQFIDATWTQLVANFGTQLHVSLTDRRDIAAQCLMGAALLQTNQSALDKRFGRKPTDSECYAAHFFGLVTAEALLSGERSQSAETALGAEAQKIISANPTIFVENGSVRTVDQVFSVLGGKISGSIVRATSLLALSSSTPKSTTESAAPVPPANVFGVGHDFLRPAMVTAIKGRFDAINQENPSSSKQDLIYHAALACENTLVCPFHDLQEGNLACAFAVNRVVQFGTGDPIDSSISTATLFASLRNKAEERAESVPGAIIISPTQGDVHGHVGIVGEGGLVYSNSSDSSTMGVFRQNYTLASWKADLVDRRQLRTHYFILS